MKPITPKEVVSVKLKQIPDEVIEVFNKLIAEDWNGTYSIVHQDNVLRMLVNSGKFTSEEIFSKNWLDVEEIYKKAGWRVEYDKPGYNESYPATFTFSVKGRKNPYE